MSVLASISGPCTACREAATWIKPLTVAVDVSAVQIHNANFAHVVHQILFETGLAPARRGKHAQGVAPT
jgi:predicted signal transduction protein with EAL and GGDEF domain